MRAMQLVELRAALSQAYAAVGRTPPRYTDSTGTGVLIRAVHIRELLAGLRALR